MPRRTSPLAPLTIALLAVSAAAALPGRAAAVHTTYWTVTRGEDFREGKVEDVSVEAPGTVSLAPKVEPRGEGGELYGWSLVAGADGNLYLGTGDDGKIYRVTPRGEQTEWFDTIEMEALALAFDGKGRLYAGGSPDGTIYRITGKDEGEVFIDTPESYVWALAFAPSGDLYAATGSRGLIYKIDSSGKGSVLLDTQDKNVLALVYDPADKSLIAGTEGRGLVLRVGLDGKSRVLFDSGHEEIGAIALAADGTIFAAGSGRGDDVEAKPDREGRDRAKTGGTTSAAKASDGDLDKSAAKTKGDATVYRIAPDGVVRRLWISEEQFIYSLLVRPDGTLIVGTGDEGAVYRVDADGKAELLTNLDESQALDMVETSAGIFVSTGNLGRVYKLGPERETSGSVESIAYDARNAARWGSLSWTAETPSGTKISFRTRTGNTEKPDETWSDWSAPLTDPAGSPISAGHSRFLQWRAELSGGGSETPKLLEARVAFVEANLPPLVGEVEVQPQNTVIYEGDPDDRPKPLFQILPDGAQVEFTLDRHDDQVFDESAAPWARAIRTVRWEALDPNGDALSYDVYYKGLDESRWKLFEKEHEIPFFAWDSESFADGDYQVRIVASDRRDNPEGEAQSGEGTSETFAIDNSPPEITGLSAGRTGRDGLTVSASARDARSLLKRAQYAVDARPWTAVSTADGVFDSREESFQFESDSLDAGEHTVVLKVFDEHGNARVARTVVR